MASEYEIAEDGEWIFPQRKDFRLVCCDCGLIHRLNFRLVKYINGGNMIQFQAFRDTRATGQRRRHLGVAITKKPDGAKRHGDRKRKGDGR